MKRKLTETETELLRVGGKQLAPGIVVDLDGDVHFNLKRMLASFDWPDDEEHRALCDTLIRRYVRIKWPAMQIAEV